MILQKIEEIRCSKLIFPKFSSNGGISATTPGTSHSSVSIFVIFYFIGGKMSRTFPRLNAQFAEWVSFTDTTQFKLCFSSFIAIPFHFNNLSDH